MHPLFYTVANAEKSPSNYMTSILHDRMERLDHTEELSRVDDIILARVAAPNIAVHHY